MSQYPLSGILSFFIGHNITSRYLTVDILYICVTIVCILNFYTAFLCIFLHISFLFTFGVSSFFYLNTFYVILLLPQHVWLFVFYLDAFYMCSSFILLICFHLNALHLCSFLLAPESSHLMIITVNSQGMRILMIMRYLM